MSFHVDLILNLIYQRHIFKPEFVLVDVVDAESVNNFIILILKLREKIERAVKPYDAFITLL
jgi:hypothetical protein